MEKEIVNQVQEAQSPKQEKPKEKHGRHKLIKLTKTKHKERILKAARKEATSNIHRKPHMLNN